MLSNKEAVSVLVPIFKSLDQPRPIILLGAGASFRSGIPTAGEAVKRIARLVYSEQILRAVRPPERIKPTEWEPWLQNCPWFIHGTDRIAENFPLIVEHLLTPANFRKRVLMELMSSRSELSSGYRALSDFVMRGLVHTVMTTNFDTCLTDALRDRQPHIRHIQEINRGPGDYAQFNVFNKSQVVWLHGRAEQYSDKNARGEIGRLDDALVRLLRPLLDASPMVVIGYRGAEASIMEGLFHQEAAGRLDFPNGVFWCTRHGETLHPYVEALHRRLGSNFKRLDIVGFDELFSDLALDLVRYDRFADELPSPSSGSFDEKVVDHATLNDLDMDLALSVLTRYCDKLKRAPISSDTLHSLMREQGLLVKGDSGDRVTVGALLLFGKSPQTFFPHAVVSITEEGKKRRVYDGNLISQHRSLLEQIDSVDVNPTLKVKKRREHEEQRAYPPRVLVELLVNMLVHRDYEREEPASIEIERGREINFLNPGGLTSRIATHIVLKEDGMFTPSENLTDQRNPSLCDIFFGINAMERAGTGLMDVAQLMTESGGTASFYHQAHEFRFRACINQPPPSGSSRTVAKSVSTDIYLLNVLPYSVVPETVNVVRLLKPLRERPETVNLVGCGTFVDLGSELWSFAPLAMLFSALEPIADTTKSMTLLRNEAQCDPNSKKVLSWLLRKHWEMYLSTFKEEGLLVEHGRRNRAYFKGQDKGIRTIVWDSIIRRHNRRDVVKKRGEGTRTWFENEGFGYETIQMGAFWGVRIKPFYMFTGRDAVTPLPSFLVASKSTRRIKFDRNKNVEADLTFWSSFLSRGNETINIGGLHVNDLLLDCSFLTVEVPDMGGKDVPQHKN